MNPQTKKRKGCSCFLYALIGLIGISFLFYLFILPSVAEKVKISSTLSQARDLGLCLYSYAADHNGKYPEGKSSTEIFQKLLDNNYLGTESGDKASTLDLLYYPMPGKIRAAPGTKVIKPENVCWDVTCCVDTQASDQLPMLFLTGYKVTYQAGVSPVPLPHPPRSWSDWWQGMDYPRKFIIVGYKGNNSMAIFMDDKLTFPNFIPADFDPKGKTYRQLTPDGELPP